MSAVLYIIFKVIFHIVLLTLKFRCLFSAHFISSLNINNIFLNCDVNKQHININECL